MNHQCVRRLVAAILIVAVVTTTLGCISSSVPRNVNMEGLQQVIQTEFVTLEGSREKIANYSGKIVLLHFFSSWCPDCTTEVPSLRNLDVALKGSDFQILGIAIDDDPFEARAFATKMRLPFPVILDNQGELKRYFSVQEVPTTMFLDRMGVPVTFQDPDTGAPTAKLRGARRWDSDRPVEMIASMIEAR